MVWELFSAWAFQCLTTTANTGRRGRGGPWQRHRFARPANHRHTTKQWPRLRTGRWRIPVVPK